MQYFAENIEKPVVFIGFLNSDCKKHYKTCAFCNILLKTLKNHWFSLVFGTQIAKIIEIIVLFCLFFHRGTYRGTSDNGRGGATAGELVTTKVRTPKCKHCLGNIFKKYASPWWKYAHCLSYVVAVPSGT